MMNSAIVVPSLNPDEKMVSYVKALSDYGFRTIIVVNDGSSEQYDSFFDEVAAVDGCVVLRHVCNCGKGRALKTAMAYYLENCRGCNGIITCDADGQHTLADTANISKLMATIDDALILGSRQFNTGDVPMRSLAGNRITSVVFKLAHGRYLSDTQTGLRGIPNKLIPELVELDGDRYEYEMNMLIDCCRRNVKIVEEPIETVYIDDNASSHFHAVRDSAKIYWVILKSFLLYLIAGLISFAVDQGIFILFDKVLLQLWFTPFGLDDKRAVWIYTATGVARVISSLLNFLLNKRFTFKQDDRSGVYLLRYTILVVVVAATSALLVWAISNFFNLSSIPVKLVVDLILVFINYTIQRAWVFNKDSDDE